MMNAIRKGRFQLAVVAGVIVAALIVGLLMRQFWWTSSHGQADVAGAHSHEGDSHSRKGQIGSAGKQNEYLQLSKQAQKNIGLNLVPVELRDYDRTISVPAVLTGQPGRARIAVSAPMTGIVKRIFVIRGEAVSPGVPLFELRLTHEDLVEKQSELLRDLEELDVVKREVTRLEKVTRSGAVAGKRLLESEYQQRKIEAIVRSKRQALILHGLGKRQIDEIVKNRRLLSSVTVKTPERPDDSLCDKNKQALQVTSLSVAPGEHVETGDRLATLADHCSLYIEGKAFEHDADLLNDAANEGVLITVVVGGGSPSQHEISGLKILYVENQVDVDSRALKFYLRLPNKMVRDERTQKGKRFIGWQYRPGQRVEVLVPVERWEKSIVLPTDAVVQDGADWFVYQKSGNRFRQTPVHVEFRDRSRVVIENDGTLFPGDLVAGKGAYQIHLAMKNKSGAAVDPYAGHSH